MSFIQKFIYASIKKSALPSYFDEVMLKKPTKFQFGIGEIIRMKNIADWYTDNFVNTQSYRNKNYLGEST